MPIFVLTIYQKNQRKKAAELGAIAPGVMLCNSTRHASEINRIRIDGFY
jgi:hypothetical protein